MKLSAYAKKLGVTYRTAWNWYTDGKIPNAMKTPSGSIVVVEETVYEEMIRCGQIKNENNTKE